MICDRHTCFCALLRSATTASSRSRSPGPSRTSMPFCIPGSSHKIRSKGIFCIVHTTRSISNFRSGVLLLQNDHIVEAQILAQCSFESLLAAATVAQEQGRFIDLLEAVDRASRKWRGELLLEIIDDPLEVDGTLRAVLKDLGPKLLKRRSTTKEIARIGPSYKAYAYYAQMSADAGHITVESLIGRYTRNRYASRPVYNDDPT